MCRLTALIACLATAAPSALLQRSGTGNSRVLRFRGGKAATLVPTQQLAEQAGDAPLALELPIASPGETSGEIMLPTAAFESLELRPGDRVRIRKLKKAALWSSVPDMVVGEVALDPTLQHGIRLTPSDMKMLALRVGENVLVAPMAPAPTPAAQDGKTYEEGVAAGRLEEVDRYRQQRRRHGWMRAAMWMMYGRPHVGYGYGYGYGHGGYGYGRRSYTRPYYGGRSAYGRGRRVGGRMGGGGRRRR